MSTNSDASWNGRKALDTVRQVLTEIGWAPQDTGTDGILRVGFDSDDIPILDAQAEVALDFERFIYYLNYRESVPSHRREAMVEFITRLNWDMVLGSLDLDLDDGALRYRAAIDFTGAELSARMVKNMIRSASDVVEEFSDVMLAVARGELEPLAALDRLG